ncbi:hypothetical protein BGZ75_000242 [Mortierella antarctica]|nr:hypothetical protein BGZ75_000242 [Mortierella antarctica]
MPTQLPNNLNISSIRNLIFDLGNVLVDLNPAAVEIVFTQLGATNFSALYSADPRSRGVVDLFQTGEMSARDFRDTVRTSIGLPSHVTDVQFDQAWSSLLLKFASGRLELIQTLRRDSHYKVYVLSNSDSILTKRLNDIYAMDHHDGSLDSLFEKVFYSHKTGFLKPDMKAFKNVIDDQHLVPGDTLFMDDADVNVKAAKSCGLQAVEVDVKTNLKTLTKGRVMV